MSDEERIRRVGQNEALYRQVNERIEDINEAFGKLTATFEIVCECGDITCARHVLVPREVYEATRKEPTLFLMSLGHEAADVETTIRSEGDYAVVRKDPGLPQRLADKTNPRGSTPNEPSDRRDV